MNFFAKDLTTTTDYYLIRSIQVNDDENSLLELNSRYEMFCYRQMHRYKGYLEENGISKEELFSQKLLLIYDAAKTFKKSKNIKYITWLGSKIRFFCLNSVNEKRKGKLKIDFKNDSKELDSLSIAKDLSLDSEKLLDREKIFSILNGSSDNRISKVFELRYFEKDNKNLPWRNLGKKMNLSSQTVINLHRKGLSLIKRKINSFKNA